MDAFTPLIFMSTVNNLDYRAIRAAKSKADCLCSRHEL